MKLKILFILVILPIFFISAYADTHTIKTVIYSTILNIEVQTDDLSYSIGDTIIISGHVDLVIGSTSIITQIIHEATYVHLAQIEVAQDGTFSETVIAEGPSWRTGEHIVRVSYQDQIAETTFTFTVPSYTTPVNSTYAVDIGDSTMDVNYSIINGLVEIMELNNDDISLDIQINSIRNGEISLELSRDLLDSKKRDGGDDTFTILIDDVEVAYQEPLAHPNFRDIIVNFDQNDSEIKIIGTDIYDVIIIPTHDLIFLENPRIVNAFGDSVEIIIIHEVVQVLSDITNLNNSEQHFYYIVNVEFEGEIMSNWVSGSLSGHQSFSPSVAWTPTTFGNHTITIDVVNNLTDRESIIDSEQIIYVNIEHPDGLSIQSDSSSYHTTDPITITGEIYGINTTSTDSITLSMESPTGTMMADTQVPLYNNEFTHTIIPSWEYIGDITVYAVFQNMTDSTTFHYSYLPLMTDELVHSMLSSLENLILSLQNTILSIDDTTRSLQGIINSQHIRIETLETILHQPTPITPPPKIVSIIADDPDDLDGVYSKDDTITIVFDSMTDTPGEDRKQPKNRVDKMFNFTDSLGLRYSGEWINNYSFRITTDKIEESSITIGETTVTPTGIIRIHSIDGTSVPSNGTSPVLFGDFGMP